MLTIYKASAGSGKTYTLAYEYIKILLGLKDFRSDRYVLNSDKYSPDKHRHSNRHRGILAITFTNKATEEMKSRIVKELDSLCRIPEPGESDSNYASALISEFGCTRSELRDAAVIAIHQLLDDFRNFNVSTIDSFFQTVLRTFAREVDHQGDYNIEMDSNYAFKSGIELMLDELNYGNPPEASRIINWIQNHTLEQINEGKEFNVFNRSSRLLNNLSKYISDACNETFRQRSEDMFAYLNAPHKITTFRKAIAIHIKELKQSLADMATSVCKGFAEEGHNEEVIPKPVRNMLTIAIQKEYPDLKNRLGITDSSNGKIIKKFLIPDVYTDSELYVKTHVRKSGKTEIFPSRALTSQLSEFIERLYYTIVKIDNLAKIKEGCDNFEFLGFAWKYIEQFRKENNIILIDDTNELLKRIINEAEMPFIYERLGMQISHLLIDEFQDTSRMQWDNLRPLVANSLAEGHDNLIIGDEKQAIYRFRNSDSSLLHHIVAQEDFPKSHIIRGKLTTENTNHRSAPGVVRFNNTLFRRMTTMLNIEGYDNVAQAIPARLNDLTAYIRIKFHKKLLSEDYPMYFEELATEILRQHDSGYKWNDIAILTKTKDEARSVVDYISTNHPEIKLISDEALLIGSSAAVKLIVSMLKLIDRSYSIRNNSEQNGAPTTYATQSDIVMMTGRYDFYVNEYGDPDQALLLALNNTEDDAENIIKNVSDIRSENPANPVALVETIIAKKIPKKQRLSEHAYIAAFQDTIIDFCERNNPSLHNFLNWWDTSKNDLSITSSPNTDAISVMTIHKSKGLEWDCVHIPLAKWDLTKDNMCWLNTDCLDFASDDIRPAMLYVSTNNLFGCKYSPFKEQYLKEKNDQTTDSMNVTYVAFTRAVRELNVYASSSSDIGLNIMNAIRQQATSLEIDSDNMLDLKAGFDETDEIFTLGEPTSAKVGKNNQEFATRNAGTYDVVFREDARELTTIEDAVSATFGDIEIGGEDDKEITETNFESRAMREAATRGNNLHNILASMITLSDLDRAIARVAAICHLSEDVQQEYRNLISEAFDAAGEQAKLWFSAKCELLIERSIYVADEDATFRPDRVMVYPDGRTVVVDYKFTTEPRQSHKKQVTAYINLLSRTGHNNIEGYLWYPELRTIIKVA